jgi:hypothetical protein
MTIQAGRIRAADGDLRLALPGGHEEAAAGTAPAAAPMLPGQRERDISSARPCSYAASRDARSASS